MNRSVGRRTSILAPAMVAAVALSIAGVLLTLALVSGVTSASGGGGEAGQHSPTQTAGETEATPEPTPETTPEPTPYFPLVKSAYTFTQGQDIGAEILPEADGGSGGFTYALSPALPGLSFDPATRALTGAPTEAGQFPMTYAATDADGATAEAHFTIEVIGTAKQQQENRPPGVLGNDGLPELPENSPPGTVVGTPHKATDPDGDPLTYWLTGTDADAFEIDSNGQITVANGAVLDYETKQTYKVTVNISDGKNTAGEPDDSADFSAEVDIHLSDVDPETLGRPDAPTVEPSSIHAIKVTWTAPANGGPITGYFVQHRKAGDDWPLTPSPSLGEELSTTISGLDPGVEYEVQVRAGGVNILPSPWSDSGYGRTFPETPPDRPDAPKVIRPKTDHVTADVSWIAPENTGRAPITGYNVRYQAVGYQLVPDSRIQFGPVADDAWVDQESSITGTTITISGLEGNTAYAVQVRAGSAGGLSEWSDTGHVGPADPSRPKRPTLSRSAANPRTAIEVAWTAPENHGPPILEYHVWYHTGDDDWKNQESPPAEARETTLTGLEPGTRYWVKVRARNRLDSDEGASAWSGESWLRTVGDYNPPTFDDPDDPGTPISETTREVVEKSPPGTNVGAPVVATDLDGDTLTYSMSGSGDFVINEDTGQISVAEGADIDHDVTPSYTVTVSVTDGEDDDGNAETTPAVDATIDVTINVIKATAPNRPDAPAVARKPSDVPMNPALDVSWTAPADNGITIGSYEVQYRQEGTAGWTEYTGVLDATADSLVLADLPKGKVYEVQVRAVSDGGNAGSWSDTGSAMTNRPPHQKKVLVSSTFRTGVVAVRCFRDLFEDPDGDTLTSDSYTVVSDREPTLTKPKPTVGCVQSEGSGAFKVKLVAPGKSRITYTANDGYGGSSSYTFTLTGEKRVTRKVVENSPAGTSVGGPVTGRPWQGETLTYALTGADAASFDINPASGQITVSEGTALDPAIKPSYAVNVDFTVGGRAARAKVTIKVVGVSDPTDDEEEEEEEENELSIDGKPVFEDGNDRQVAENSPAGTEVGAPVTATDPDGDVLTYSMSGAAEFVIDPATGQISVAQGATLDYETTQSYPVTVSVTDGKDADGNAEAEPVIDAAATVIIAVTDVDEPPDAPDAPTVTGNSTNRVTASWTLEPYADRPPITSHDLQYRKQGDTAWILIEPVGLATARAIGGLESNTFYEAQVRAINDEGRSEWSATGTGSTLPPSTTNPDPDPPPNRRPVFEGGNNREVAENSPAGTAVGAPVTATDDDGDVLTYSLSGAAEFVIDEATGQISVAQGARLDYEATESYPVTVSVTDGKDAEGNTETTPVVDATATVTIAVTDVAEPPDAPDAPTVTGNSIYEATASWTLSIYTDRPAITNHDLQYRKQGDTAWILIEPVGLATAHAIGGLESSTFYEAQVRAINDEGRSEWSETGTGKTLSPFIRNPGPTPTPTPTPQPTPAPTPEPTPTPTPEPTPAPTPEPPPAPTLTLTPTPAPAPTPTPEPTLGPTPTPTPTPQGLWWWIRTATPEPTPAPTPEPTPAPNDPEENGPGNPSNLGDNQAVINSGSGGNTVIGPGNPRNSGGAEPRNPRNDAGIGPGNLRNFGGSAALGNVGADGGADDSGGDNGAAVGSSGFGLVDWAATPAAEGSLADANDLGETPSERNVWQKVTDDRLIPIWWWLLLAIALAVAGRIAYKVWRDRMERDSSFF